MNNTCKSWKARALEALDGSIRHWQRMHDDIEGAYKIGETPTARRCTCCVEFMFESGVAKCTFCPVALYTGEYGCVDTPYEEAAYAWRDVMEGVKPKDYARQAWQDRSQEEIDFLKFVREQLVEGKLAGNYRRKLAQEG